MATERVTLAPLTMRSELGLEPLMTPVTLKVALLRLSVVPFLTMPPERERTPPTVLEITLVPLPRTEIFLSRVPPAPVYWSVPEEVAATPRVKAAAPVLVPRGWALLPVLTALMERVPFCTAVAPV